MKLLTSKTDNFDLFLYLDKFYDIRRDRYTNQIHIKRRSDGQTLNKYDLLLELEKQNIRISKTKLDYLFKSSKIKEYSPYENKIYNLPQWTPDQDSEIKKLLKYIETDDDNRFAGILYKWLVNSLLQILGKNINDVMLILVSQQKQGIGKTYFIRKLIDFLPYIQTGQSLLKNHENLPEAAVFYPFIFYDEMENLRSDKELLLFKTIISSEQIEYRKFQQIYRRPRIANFIGTADSSELLFDPSGSRRFAIVEIKTIDFAYSKKIDFSKIWAEAWFYVKSAAYKDLLWTQKDFRDFEEYNTKYYKTTSIEFFINKYLVPGTPNDGQMLTSGEILALISDLAKSNGVIQKTDVRSVGIALKKLGFSQYYTRRDGRMGRYYYVKVRKNL